MTNDKNYILDQCQIHKEEEKYINTTNLENYPLCYYCLMNELVGDSEKYKNQRKSNSIPPFKNQKEEYSNYTLVSNFYDEYRKNRIKFEELQSQIFYQKKK